ncbi:hypothetical protein ACFL4U_03125, partial [Candidatus Neomarinimicrobiota bacterium]
VHSNGPVIVRRTERTHWKIRVVTGDSKPGWRVGDYDPSYPPGLFLLMIKSQKGELLNGKNGLEISSR